jgi:hypothetical protein
MGLLDDLKKQAEMVKTQQNFQQTLREDTLKLVEEKMKQTFHYVNELLKQLAVLKPVNPLVYTIPGVGDIKNLGFAESFIDYRRKRIDDRDYMESIAFFIRWASGDKLVVERDMPAAAQKVRDVLFAYRLKFAEEEVRNQRGLAATWRFGVESGLVTDIAIKADHKEGKLLITAKNLEHLGADDFALPAVEINEALLEEFAKILLGHPGGFRKYRIVAAPR